VVAAPPDAGGRADSGGHPPLAVIVVNWHREQETIDCVNSLQSWQRLCPEIIVVDNGSGLDAVSRLREALPGVEILANDSNLGFGAANNRALASTGARVVLLLNNDARIGEEDTTRLLETLRSRPQAGFVGPVLEGASPPHPVLSAGGRDPVRFGRTHSTADDRRQELERAEPFAVDYVPGTALLALRRTFEALDGFEEDFFFSGETADLCARGRRLGYQSFVVPLSRCRHNLETSAPLRDTLYAYYSLRNRFLLLRRSRGGGLAGARWVASGALRSLLSLATGRIARARCLVLALADGLRGRFGPANPRVER